MEFCWSGRGWHFPAPHFERILLYPPLKSSPSSSAGRKTEKRQRQKRCHQPQQQHQMRGRQSELSPSLPPATSRNRNSNILHFRKLIPSNCPRLSSSLLFSPYRKQILGGDIIIISPRAAPVKMRFAKAALEGRGKVCLLVLQETRTPDKLFSLAPRGEKFPPFNSRSPEGRKGLEIKKLHFQSCSRVT